MSKKVFMVLPAKLKTGGPEAGFQFIQILSNHGIEAKIAFYDLSEIKSESPVCSDFECYQAEYVDFKDIEDSSENIVVFPEIFISHIPNYRYAKSVIWWLSVDNYLNFSTPLKYIKTRLKKDGILSAVYRGYENWFLGEYRRKRKMIQRSTLHLYQSEYARLFLESLGLSNYLPLSDYLNASYLKEANLNDIPRENIVLYNPKKGIKFTKKIMRCTLGVQWIALDNMSTQEVCNMLHKAKVYIDFGEHPGKDRLPREAAISGCCIITGRKGSAANSKDICIPKQYKFNNNVREIENIRLAIQFCVADYENRVKDFQTYRESILEEKDIFKDQALKVVHYFDTI